MATGTGIAGKPPFQCFLRCCFILLLLVEFSDGQADVLAQGEELTPGYQLISATGIFSLGFYGPIYSNTSYIGIWYNRFSLRYQPVWIANRNSPIPSNSGLFSLTIDSNGSLKIVQKGGGRDGYGYSFSLFDVDKATNSSAILQDNGNLVLRELNPDGSVKRQLWQSFDHPTDTLLPGMKLGINHKTGSTWSLTSWRSDYSPLTGAFTLTMNPNNTNQLLILLRGAIFWTSGNWQGSQFEFLNKLSSINEDFHFNRFSNENETFFTYSTSNFYGSYQKSTNVLPQWRLDNYGNLVWNDRDSEVLCPFFENEIPNGISGEGCVGKRQHKIPECRNPPMYIFGTTRYGYMEGNGSKYKGSENLTEYECRNICISDCDCIAYGSTNKDGLGCEIWSAGATFTSVDGGAQWVVFLNGNDDGDGKEKTKVWLKVIIGLIVPATFLLLCFVFYVKWRTQILRAIEKIRKKDSERRNFLHEMGFISKSFNILRIKNKQRGDMKKNSELQFFSFESVVSATSNFADKSKLGEGGFGPVYKGSLTDGQEVAIKRLSKNSGQGLEEFKNEAILIAKLQHTNLVRLIGCCIYKEEKLLVYEYMPNKSLDSFLFDSKKKLILDWDKRLHIIQGIIQGLLYLHTYSRLRIIHRDLKVSNILLDDEMSAKISDFGMARIFKPTEHEANTSRIVGTYGYISPEYAMEGIFSIKSDVYSFGVLLLEILTGRKNYNNYDPERPLNLIGYAWELWVNGRGEELIDSALCNSDQKQKALRCIHVSLLCVQQIPADRPTMLDVSFMIHHDSTQLSSPKQPAFFIARNSQSEVVMAGAEVGLELAPEICSLNKMSLSVMVAR